MCEIEISLCSGLVVFRICQWKELVQNIQPVQVRRESPPGVAKYIFPLRGAGKKKKKTTSTQHGAEHRGIEQRANGSSGESGR